MLKTIAAQRLVFDDDSIEEILYGTGGQQATEADGVAFWRGGGDLQPQNIDAVAANTVELLFERAKLLLVDQRDEDLLTVRSLALELFVEGYYDIAEELYRRLLDKGFQVPGTMIHLARVLLMQNRIEETRTVLAKAVWLQKNWIGASCSSRYVLQRTIFLQILCAMLARKNYSFLVMRLQKELAASYVREGWTIEPVIQHFEERLREDELKLLRELSRRIITAAQ